MDQEQVIGLYGGSFDPPHLTHSLVIAWALASGTIHQVWVIPSNGHPFGKKLSPFEARMEMCYRAFDFFGDRVHILDIEKEPRTHYSIDTVKQLVKQHPKQQWRWIMGGDAFAESAKWRQFDELKKLAPIFVVPRQQSGDDHLIALPNLSSSLIREALGKHDFSTAKAFLHEKTIAYILEKELYLH